MQHINNNMDELFQKAAEDYPLRTDSADWAAVQSKLSLREEQEVPVRNNGFRKKLQRSIVVASLIIVPFSVSNYLQPFKLAITSKNNTSKIDAVTSVKSKEEDITDHHASNFAVTRTENIATNQSSILTERLTLKNSITDFSLNQSLNNNSTQEFLQHSNKSSSIPQPLLKKDATVLKNEELKALTEKTIAKENVESSVESKKKELIKLEKPKNIYAGFIGTGELTNVHGQAFRKPGFNGGFVLGYNLSNRLQAEVGLIASRKYYYSDGKYASPNSLRDDGLAIGGVKVYSTMAEVPLLLRYNITNTNTNKFFVAGGGVANFVHKEHYNYGYKKDGRDRKAGKVYDNSVDNLFSNIQLSVGYEHKLSNATFMRVEPYYRLPLNGTGVANFHVTSMGINLGVIKYFK